VRGDEKEQGGDASAAQGGGLHPWALYGGSKVRFYC